MSTEGTYKVLPSYTDESMDARIDGRSDSWAKSQRALRTVPAEWRQSVWAAANTVAYRPTVTYRNGWAELGEESTGVDFDDAIRRQVAAFHGGHRPKRMETFVPEETS